MSKERSIEVKQSYDNTLLRCLRVCMQPCSYIQSVWCKKSAELKCGDGRPKGPLKVKNITPTSVVLTWTPPDDDIPKAYEFEIQQHPNGKWVRLGKCPCGRNDTATVEGLNPNTCYNFKIRAVYPKRKSDPLQNTSPICTLKESQDGVGYFQLSKKKQAETSPASKGSCSSRPSGKQAKKETSRTSKDSRSSKASRPSRRQAKKEAQRACRTPSVTSKEPSKINTRAISVSCTSSKLSVITKGSKDSKASKRSKSSCCRRKKKRGKKKEPKPVCSTTSVKSKEEKPKVIEEPKPVCSTTSVKSKRSTRNQKKKKKEPKPACSNTSLNSKCSKDSKGSQRSARKKQKEPKPVCSTTSVKSKGSKGSKRSKASKGSKEPKPVCSTTSVKSKEEKPKVIEEPKPVCSTTSVKSKEEKPKVIEEPKPVCSTTSVKSKGSKGSKRSKGSKCSKCSKGSKGSKGSKDSKGSAGERNKGGDTLVYSTTYITQGTQADVRSASVSSNESADSKGSNASKHSAEKICLLEDEPVRVSSNDSADIKGINASKHSAEKICLIEDGPVRVSSNESADSKGSNASETSAEKICVKEDMPPPARMGVADVNAKKRDKNKLKKQKLDTRRKKNVTMITQREKITMKKSKSKDPDLERRVEYCREFCKEEGSQASLCRITCLPNKSKGGESEKKVKTKKDKKLFCKKRSKKGGEEEACEEESGAV